MIISLFHMERYENLLNDPKEIYRLGTVVKDRTGLIDGQTFKNPGFEAFRPVMDWLTTGVEPRVLTKTGDDSTLIRVAEDDHRDRRERKKCLERCYALLDRHAGGQKKEDKEKRFEAMKVAFGDTSETAIAELYPEQLMSALEKLESFFNVEVDKSQE